MSSLTMSTAVWGDVQPSVSPSGLKTRTLGFPRLRVRSQPQVDIALPKSAPSSAADKSPSETSA